MSPGDPLSGTRQRPAPLAEINVVPLVDVMLVLLVVFIITAPLLTHAVRIELPKASSAPNVSRAAHVELALRADGGVFWNGAPLPPDDLRERLAAAAAESPQPELHLRIDRLTAYERVAVVLALARQQGLMRIGFLSDPDEVRMPVAGERPR